MSQTMTPREIISELDRFIIGQDDAKRAVAIALRNRWRRQQVESPMREEITPKNILMIGPTGVGKTEIARRLARLANAPFIKVEATKFTEVGYVGRDVETIIRDLVDTAIKIVREEHLARVQIKAEKAAEDRLLDILIPHPVPASGPVASESGSTSSGSREKMRKKLRAGDLDERQVEIEIEQSSNMPMMQIFSNQGTEEMDLKDMLGNMMGGKNKSKRMNVADALVIIQQQEADRLLDMDTIKEDAIKRIP
jgi:ATP-dependent HslUV protease ATP-binding subunit HslU